jgi:hypothetical protein
MNQPASSPPACGPVRINGNFYLIYLIIRKNTKLVLKYMLVTSYIVVARYAVELLWWCGGGRRGLYRQEAVAKNYCKTVHLQHFRMYPIPMCTYDLIRCLQS